jgi:hypothetical protein
VNKNIVVANHPEMDGLTMSIAKDTRNIHAHRERSLRGQPDIALAPFENNQEARAN